MDLKNEEKKQLSVLSMEQQRKDGINKDKKRVLENLQKKREQEEQDQIHLQEMKPEIIFKRGCIQRINKTENFCLGNGEKDQQVEIQIQREKKILSKLYYQEENIPKMPGLEQMQKCDSRQSKITKTKQQIENLNQKNNYSNSISLSQSNIITEFPLQGINEEGIIPISQVQQQIGQVAFIPILINDGNVAIPVNALNELNTEKNIGNTQFPSSTDRLMQKSMADFNIDINKNLLKISPESEKMESDRFTDEITQHVNYLKKLSNKYRTTPCKNYHGPQGCGRGTFCHFIHLVEFEGKEIPKDISQKARLAYTNKRNKVLKEIDNSESKCGLSDTRIRVLYQYTQNFMKLNEIMEFAEKQKQFQLAPQIEEPPKFSNSVQKSQNSYLNDEKTFESLPKQNQNLKSNIYKTNDKERADLENSTKQTPLSSFIRQPHTSSQNPNSIVVSNLSTINSKAGSYIRVVQNQNARVLYNNFPVQVGANSKMQSAYNSYIMGTSKDFNKK